MPARRADDTSYALLVNGFATGNGVVIKGGEYMIYFDGNLNGATISLQTLSPSGQWMTVEAFTGSAISYSNTPRSQTGIDLPAGQARCALNGGTPSGINAYLVGLG